MSVKRLVTLRNFAFKQEQVSEVILFKVSEKVKGTRKFKGTRGDTEVKVKTGETENK